MSDFAQSDLVSMDVTKDLQKLLDQHPLPLGVSDADLNMDDIAAAFNV